MLRKLARTMVMVSAPVMFSINSDASPQSVRSLMEQPVTMFEWGLARLEERVRTMPWDPDIASTLLLPQEARVRYEPKTNHITIGIRLFQKNGSLRRTPPQQTCGSVMRQLKTLLDASDLSIPGLGIENFFASRGTQS